MPERVPGEALPRWEALVAIGTLLLAEATAYVAYTTRSVARETRDSATQTAADLQAQWRPRLVPVQSEPPILLTEGMAQETTPYALGATIWNAGRGPALFVRVQHDPSNNSPENWSLGSLSPGERIPLAFQGIGQTSISQLLIDYRDLAGRSYSTAVVLDHSVPNKTGRLTSLPRQSSSVVETRSALRDFAWRRRLTR